MDITTTRDLFGEELVRHSERPLMRLSAAIACGDLTEAAHWLAQVGMILGDDAQGDIDAGRFTPCLAGFPSL